MTGISLMMRVWSRPMKEAMPAMANNVSLPYFLAMVLTP